MSAAFAERAAWILIFAGLLAGGFGVTVLDDAVALGTGVLLAAGAALIAGVVLIWMRSRMQEGR